MSLLLETIRLCDGEFNNLVYHSARMKRARKDLFQRDDSWDILEILKREKFPTRGLFKCRVTYDAELKSVDFEPYEIKPLSTLKLIEDNAITYPHKFKDRISLERLYAKRGVCSDVLIVSNGHVTDTSYANIIFRHNKAWFTPASPLLPGTMRQSLIDRKEVRATEIRVADLARFESFKLINSMILLNSPECEISKIIY